MGCGVHSGDYSQGMYCRSIPFAAEVRSSDWSDEVAPFWGEVIKSALSARGIAGLLSAGWTTIKGALVMPLMAQGYRRGLIKFVLITGVKE